MTTISRTDKLWDRAFTSAERFFIRFSAPDIHRTAGILHEIRRLAFLVAKSGSRAAIRRADARIYTHMQSALKSKTRLSRNSILFRAEDLFHETKNVLDSVRHLNAEPPACRGLIEGKLAQMGELFLLLELQLTALTGRRTLAMATQFTELAAEIREELKKCRLQVLTGENTSGNVQSLTMLEAISKWLSSAEYLACSSLRTRLGRRKEREKE